MEPGSERITAHLLIGLDLLALLLLVVALGRPAGSLWMSWLVSAGFAACWTLVRLRARTLGQPMDSRGGWWPGGAAASALLAGYVAVLLVSNSGMWLAFPVMLLQLHLLGPRAGGVAITLTTVAAVALGAVARGDTGLGYVLGPVIGAAVAVAAIVGLESLARVVDDRQHALDELRRAQQRLLDAERDRSRAEERAHLARDIHDTLAQDFAAIELHLRAVAGALAGDSPARPGLALAQRATAEGLAQARRFIAGEPGHRGEATTLDAIRAAADRAVADSRGRTAIAVRSVGAEPSLPAPLSTELLRMTQSALSNVVRHADADSASVTLTWTPDCVLLDIVDDGCGFDPDRDDGPTRAGFGLTSLRNRVHDLNGTIGVESVPGEGTAIAISLPLTPDTR